MNKAFVMCALCVMSTPASVHAETFVIEADKAGHEATVKLPAAAVTKMSANRAETLEGYAGSQIEAMRLSGDVLIGIAGSTQAIEIRADSVVVELTADSAPNPERRGRGGADRHEIVRSTSTSTSTSSGDQSQVFVGNVVFDLQTTSGPMEIKADRVEHQAGGEPGA